MIGSPERLGGNIVGISSRVFRFQTLLRLAVVLLAVTWVSSVYALTEDAESYVQSANQLLQRGDLRGAAIQLRNAIQKAPEDGALRVKLGQVYLALGDPIAAEATVVAARERGISEEVTAGVLAEALYE